MRDLTKKRSVGLRSSIYGYENWIDTGYQGPPCLAPLSTWECVYGGPVGCVVGSQTCA